MHPHKKEDHKTYILWTLGDISHN